MDEKSSKPRRLALPWRIHWLLACAVAVCVGFPQLISTGWGHSLGKWSEAGWPAVWYRETTLPSWERGFNDWSHPERTVAVLPVGLLLNLTFFVDVWLLLALAAETLAARRFSLAGLFALMFLVALLLGLLLGAKALSKMEGEPLVMNCVNHDFARIPRAFSASMAESCCCVKTDSLSLSSADSR